MSRGWGLCTRQAPHCQVARGPQTTLETRTPRGQRPPARPLQGWQPPSPGKPSTGTSCWTLQAGLPYLHGWIIHGWWQHQCKSVPGRGKSLSLSLKLSPSPILTAEPTAIYWPHYKYWTWPSPRQRLWQYSPTPDPHWTYCPGSTASHDQTYYQSSKDSLHPSIRKVSVWDTNGSLPT